MSTATVSAVINDSAYVSPELRTRVLTAIRDLGYAPSTTARNLRSGRSQLIGLVVADLANPFFSRVVWAAEAAVAGWGYSMVVFNSDEKPEAEKRILARIRALSCDGVSGAIDCVYGARRDGLGQRVCDGAHVVEASRAICARHWCRDCREVLAVEVADGASEISHDRSPVSLGRLSPLFGEFVPRAAAVAIGVHVVQKRFGCLCVVPSPCQPLHLGKRTEASEAGVPHCLPG